MLEAEKALMEGPGRNWVDRILKREIKKVARGQNAHAANENLPAAANDHHDVPVAATFEQLFTEIWQNADRPIAPELAEFYQMAEVEARRELQRTLDANATLTLAPDDFMRLYSEMQKVAHEMVRETRDLAAGAGKTQIGSNVLREKVKQTVHKFVGSKNGPAHVNCTHGDTPSPKQPATAPTLSHVCGIELRLPSLFHQHS